MKSGSRPELSLEIIGLTKQLKLNSFHNHIQQFLQTKQRQRHFKLFLCLSTTGQDQDSFKEGFETKFPNSELLLSFHSSEVRSHVSLDWDNIELSALALSDTSDSSETLRAGQPASYSLSACSWFVLFGPIPALLFHHTLKQSIFNTRPQLFLTIADIFNYKSRQN